MKAWQARAEAYIMAGLLAKVPDLVRPAMSGLLEPIQRDLTSPKGQQKKLDQSATQLNNEAHAA